MKMTNITALNMKIKRIYLTILLVFMDQQCFHLQPTGRCPLTLYAAYDVCRGRHKPLIGQHVTEATAGQTQQLLIVLSATDVMWLVWHIVSVDKMTG